MDRQALIEDLILDEDLRLKPYRDSVGKLTIGVGRNLDDRGLSREECLYLAANDIDWVEAELDASLPWWRELDSARQRVLANMCFNLGTPKLLTFTVTLGHIKEGRYQRAADAMLASKWAKQVGQRALRLAHLMRTGQRLAT